MTYGNTVEGAAQEQGEVKCGGEDGKASNGGPHKEKKGGEKVDFYNVRRGRGTVQPAFVFCTLLTAISYWCLRSTRQHSSVRQSHFIVLLSFTIKIDNKILITMGSNLYSEYLFHS